MQEIFDLIWNYITLNWVDILIFIYSLITTIVAIVKAKKNKDLEKEEIAQEELKKLLKEKIIPLMEEVEQKIGYTAEDKKNWVIKKLGDMLHTDLFIHVEVLEIIEKIIKEICETTKINVNKIRVVEEKKGGADNEQEIY